MLFLQVTGAVQQGDTVLDTCSGSWLTHLEWEQGVCTSTDGQRLCRVWDEAAAPVRQPAALDKPLPSDSRFREDLQALKVWIGSGTLCRGLLAVLAPI